MALNRARVAKDIGITNSMDYLVVVEYFDSAAPSTVLWTETFQVSRNATTAQLQAIVTDRGQVVRAGLAGLAAAQAAVPNQTVVTVP